MGYDNYIPEEVPTAYNCYTVGMTMTSRFILLERFTHCGQLSWVLTFSPSLRALQSAHCPHCKEPQTGPEGERSRGSRIYQGVEQRHTAHGPVEAEPPGMEQEPPVQSIHIVIGQHLQQHVYTYYIHTCR